MRTISCMSGIPNSPDLIILCATHPTPFVSTSNWSRGALDMITSIHFLNPTTTETRFRIGFKPSSGLFVGCKVLIADAGPILHASDLWVSRSAAMETGFKLTSGTGEMR